MNDKDTESPTVTLAVEAAGSPTLPANKDDSRRVGGERGRGGLVCAMADLDRTGPTEM